MVGLKKYINIKGQTPFPLSISYYINCQTPTSPHAFLNSHGPGITGPKFRAYKKEEKKDKKIQLIQIVFNAVYIFFLYV